MREQPQTTFGIGFASAVDFALVRDPPFHTVGKNNGLLSNPLQWWGVESIMCDDCVRIEKTLWFQNRDHVIQPLPINSRDEPCEISQAWQANRIVRLLPAVKLKHFAFMPMLVTNFDQVTDINLLSANDGPVVSGNVGDFHVTG
jgi:hypothetical protein